MSATPEPLLLIPGLTCDAAVWQGQISALRPLRPLHVVTHHVLPSLTAMAEHILSSAPPRFAVAGHSMGGRIALELMALAPQRITRIALLDSGYEARPTDERGERERLTRMRFINVARRQGMLAMGKDWTQGMVHPDRLNDAVLMESIHQMIARAPVDLYEAQIRALLDRPDRSALLPQIRVPTLLLCGHEDSWSPIERHIEMAERIPGSHLVDLPHCGHMAPMEQPVLVSNALTNWLNS
jgi:pimeloyl-ACP methyl ester carboxylesterase